MASPLVGREQELDEVVSALDALRAGPQAVVLEGEAGIGKTALWREALRLAEQRSFRALSCAAGELELQLAYAPLGDLLRPVLAERRRLPAPQRNALDVALLLTEPEGPPADVRAVAVATVTLLERLVDAGPVVVAVDDVQWLDASTERVLAFVVRRLRDLPVAILVTRRIAAPEVAPLGLQRAFAEGGLRRVMLGPLDVDATAALLADRLRARFPRATLIDLHRATNGNPFYALEIGRSLLERGTAQPGAPLPVPPTLRSLIEERLARLSEAARRSLVVASAVRDGSRDIVCAALPEAPAGLEEAAAAGVVRLENGRVRFTHPLLAAAVYEDSSAEDRRRLHRRLAQLVGDHEERARHLALATTTPDAEVASALEEAARRARSRGAPATAAAFADEAVRLTPAALEPVRTQRTLAAAEWHYLAGDTSRARALFESVAASQVGEMRAQALHGLARVLVGTEGYPPSVDALERALPIAADPVLQVNILVDLVSALLQMGQLRRADGHAATALELAERVAAPEPLAAALTNAAMTDFLLGRGLRSDLLERAAALRPRTESSTQFPPEFLWTLFLKWTDELEQARARLVEMHRDARERHEENLLPLILWQLSEVECWIGDFELAAEHAEEGAAVAIDTEQLELISPTRYALALAEAHLGHVERSRAAANDGLRTAQAAGNHRHVIRCLAVLGFVELSLGDAVAAHSQLEPALTLIDEAGYAEPGVLRFEHDAAEALVGLGELDNAERLARRLEESGRMLGRRFALATGARSVALVCAARGDPAGASAALERALAAHRDLQQPFELARTLLVLGAVRRRQRQKRLAREALVQSRDLFEQLHAPLWAAKARDELLRIGGRPAAPAQLSAAEQRVAGLAARGYTNREIAESLFMSVKTVERHLSHVFAKLDIASRRELRSRIGAQTEGIAPISQEEPDSTLAVDGDERRT